MSYQILFHEDGQAGVLLQKLREGEEHGQHLQHAVVEVPPPVVHQAECPVQVHHGATLPVAVPGLHAQVTPQAHHKYVIGTGTPEVSHGNIIGTTQGAQSISHAHPGSAFAAATSSQAWRNRYTLGTQLLNCSVQPFTVRHRKLVWKPYLGLIFCSQGAVAKVEDGACVVHNAFVVHKDVPQNQGRCQVPWRLGAGRLTAGNVQVWGMGAAREGGALSWSAAVIAGSRRGSVERGSV